jgi:hypothetical protein
MNRCPRTLACGRDSRLRPDHVHGAALDCQGGAMGSVQRAATARHGAALDAAVPKHGRGARPIDEARLAGGGQAQRTGLEFDRAASVRLHPHLHAPLQAGAHAAQRGPHPRHVDGSAYRAANGSAAHHRVYGGNHLAGARRARQIRLCGAAGRSGSAEAPRRQGAKGALARIGHHNEAGRATQSQPQPM